MINIIIDIAVVVFLIWLVDRIFKTIRIKTGREYDPKK